MENKISFTFKKEDKQVIAAFAILNNLLGTGSPVYSEILPSKDGKELNFFWKGHKHGYDLPEKFFPALQRAFRHLFPGWQLKPTKGFSEDYWCLKRYQVVKGKTQKRKFLLALRREEWMFGKTYWEKIKISKIRVEPDDDLSSLWKDSAF